jgi:hypothetical protein
MEPSMKTTTSILVVLALLLAMLLSVASAVGAPKVSIYINATADDKLVTTYL